MAARIRDADWTATPIGPAAGWPQPLATLVGVMLGSDQPMFVLWGVEQILLYNDRYAELLGRKHPHALARPFLEVWSEARETLEPLITRTYAGESISMSDLPVVLERHGYPEEAHFAFSYTPVLGMDGAVLGLFCPCIETTPQILSERREIAERARMHQMFDQAPGFMAMLSGPDHVFQFVNRAYAQLIGNREVVGLPFRVALSEIGAHAVAERLDRVFADGVAMRENAARIRLERVPGEPAEERFIDIVYQPVTDASGRVTGIFVEGADVTERVHAEESLREVVGLNASILNSSRDCIVVLDLDANLRFVSPGGVEGMEIDDIRPVIGRNWLNVWDGLDKQAAEAAVAAARAGAVGRFQGYCATHKGTPKWWDLAVSPLPGLDGRPRQLVSVGREITEQKQAELALKQLNDTLEEHVDARTRERDRLWQLSKDLLVVADYHGAFIRVSPSWTTALGLGEDALLGASYADRVHPDDAATVIEAIRVMRASGEAVAFEDRWRAVDGSWRWFSWTLSPDPDGDRLTGVGRDITDAKARQAELEDAQDALRQSQKLEAVGQLTGGVAHDFNNLLTVIRGSIDLLRRPALSDEKRERYMGAISDTVDRASKLTGQLLAFARRQALQPEIFDASRNVAGVSDMLGTLTGARVEVSVDVPDAPCAISADPSQFDTAIVNMVVNARDAMDGEGKLVISVRRVDGIPPMRSHPPISGDFVAVALTDSGSGIAADRIDRIFEPFYTTKGIGHGTGLGLSQVFGFAKQSGGEVQVESIEGEGSTFTLYLPSAAEERVDDLAAANAGPAMEGQGASVLLVEDNDDVGLFAKQMLEELGYRTTLARDGHEALTMLADASGGFDVVFSDVVMPAMGGVELGQEIRRRHAGLPVILTSGYSDVLAEEGTHGFELLRKPYSLEQLSRMLRKAVV